MGVLGKIKAFSAQLGAWAELGNFKENLSVNKVFHCACEAFMSMRIRLS